MVSAGNGWYRCSVAYTAGGNDRLGALAIVGSASATRLQAFTAAGTESIFLWGQQIEQRSSVTAYTPTTTQPITNYIPALQTAAAGVARFDHNPITGESLGLLIEEQRTNLLTYSDDLSNAAWTKSNSSIDSNVIVAPDGTLTGDRLIENTSLAEHFASQNFTFVSGTSYSWSVFVKPAGRTLVHLRAGNTTTFPPRAIFDVSAGTVTSNPSGTATIQNVGNGWYRCTISGAAGASSFTSIRIQLVSTGTTDSYTGDDYSGVFLWGAQLEAGAFPTSYIPTTTAQVTRSADAASMTGANFSSWYRADEGTLYAESIFSEVTTAQASVCGIELNSTNRIQIGKRAGGGSATDYKSFVLVGNVAQVALTQTNAIVSGTAIKSATSFAVNDFAMSVSANAVQTDDSGILAEFNRLNIGSSNNNVNIINGTIKKIAYYPKRIANAELQALTQN
jgi:hypothetical protein